MFYKCGLNIFYNWEKLSFFFSNFITVWRAEGDWLPNIKTQRKFSKAIRADGIFCFTLGRFFMSTTKPNCRSRSKPKTSLNQQDWFNRTFMPLDQTMIKQFMIAKFVTDDVQRKSLEHLSSWDQMVDIMIIVQRFEKKQLRHRKQSLDV